MIGPFLILVGSGFVAVGIKRFQLATACFGLFVIGIAFLYGIAEGMAP